MKHRPRRLRKKAALRSLVRETNLHRNDLVYPLFAVSGQGVKREMESLPGNYHFSIDQLLVECERIRELGIKSILLFGIPEKKDDEGSPAWDDRGIVQQAISEISQQFPELEIITDVCLCAYTNHGHCGVIDKKEVDNDSTLKRLQKVALSHARAGADMVAPSDMMDGRVGAIREALDENGFTETGIMSYSAKYNSSFYGPFREAAQSAPDFGDRASYQMDPANAREALKEVKLDLAEGADIVMVKPALSFLDIIYRVKNNFEVPVAAYNVSGEYSLVCQGGKESICNREEMMIEILTSIKRAGADILITYYAPEMAEILG